MPRANAIAVPLVLRTLAAELASADVADDQRWILLLMQKKGPDVMAMLWRMLGAESDVLDAYQTAVCGLSAKGHEVIRSNRAGYFYRTAMNAAIEILRSRKRNQEHLPAIAEVYRRRQGTASPEARLDHRETMQQLRQAICRLPRQLRSVIVLRDLGEMSYRQVAKTMGIEVTTARLYRRQAVVRLADLLQEEVCRGV